MAIELTAVTDFTSQKDAMSKSSDAGRTPNKLIRIQYLRGIAASMVVVHHVLHPRPWLFTPLGEIDLGRPGILIFFVISGFVMLYACGTEPVAQFFRRRVVRIVPLYWIMSLAIFVVLVRNDIIAGEPLQRVPSLVQSLFFVPHYHFAVDDRIWPVLVPGWTLNYEMFFFVIFAIGIAVRRVFWVPVVILLSLVALGLVFDFDNAVLSTWTNPFLLMFVIGLWLARRFRAGGDFNLAPWLILPGVVLITAGAFATTTVQWSEPVFFVAAALIVAGVLGFEARGPGRSWPVLARIGDASYSIYLSHTIVLIPVLRLMRELPLDGWLQFAVVSVGSIGISLVVGIFVWKWLEVPLLDYFLRRKPAQIRP
ncbi:MAG: acyltransferase [Pseudomonadota bacterium]